MSEFFIQETLKKMMSKNRIVTSLIGKGFHGTITPSPIRRYVLENPKWYTPYSPYQAEISQGRLEGLFNFQKMISSITGLPLSNASLLDGGSTAAEVLSMSNTYHKDKRSVYYASNTLHPYIQDILKTKATAMDIDMRIMDPNSFNFSDDTIGFMIQYPDTHGNININHDMLRQARERDIVSSCSTDLMALAIFESPGKFGFNMAFGSAQRFGVPMYYGGPHAAFLATDTRFMRIMPGRVVGITKDRIGNPCYRLALQSREQHIRKERATSNICTSQALLANISTLYAMYHGERGIMDIAKRIYETTCKLKESLEILNYNIQNTSFFDTITIYSINAKEIYDSLKKDDYVAFWDYSNPSFLSITLDETTRPDDIENIVKCFQNTLNMFPASVRTKVNNDTSIMRKTPYLPDETFHRFNKNETEFMRYAIGLADKDYGLTHGMIPLGSCTMKENSAYQLEPLSWEVVGNCHPFLPKEYVKGYHELIEKTGNHLKNVTGFNHVSFQSNSGAMGEYSALLCIRKYHNNTRKTVIIPESAHGTNFASASLAGLKVKRFNDELFDDIDAFDKFVSKIADDLAGMMITYPNTNGVFQKDVEVICDIIHKYGGIVYLDGANMNALAGVVKPSDIGADVCHLNLHKTFCIPHGGGGPGMGPILCNDKLAPYLPRHVFQSDSNDNNHLSIGTITASQWSSASLLVIPYSHFEKQGENGIKAATKQAISNANYMKDRLKSYYKIDSGDDSEVAHEFIIDLSEFKEITDVDVAKRLIDYCFHPPTMSWPKKSSLMIEPTETETREEIDRFVEAMISIRREIDEQPLLLKNAPHPIQLTKEEWNYPYSMREAFFPVNKKYWPSTSRVDDLYGDKMMYKLQ